MRDFSFRYASFEMTLPILVVKIHKVFETFKVLAELFSYKRNTGISNILARASKAGT